MLRSFLPLFFFVPPLLAAPLPIVIPANSSPDESLAAHEVRRYVYLRTGELLPIQTQSGKAGKACILVARKNQPETKRLAGDIAALEAVEALKPQEYLLKKAGQNSLLIAGGDDAGVLYGAYAFAEKLGVRFYLHGDVVPDGKMPFSIPDLNETGKPLFETRGIQPFHDFPEGPDWWNRDDYLACVSQLAKLRMNFLGLHCYPEGGVGPEPLVWIGLPEDVNADGTVKFSYPARWASTENGGIFGYASVKTGDFAGGASLLFPTDTYGPDVMQGLMPRPAMPGQCNELFNRVGAQMRAVFAEAKQLGVKTCVGTETPLTIPQAVREHLKQLGRNPDDPAVKRALYTGMFQRVMTAMPADYYWLWTPESWTWSGAQPGQFRATTQDIQAALDALQALGGPFTLATSGWVLGPQANRAALDEFLPKNSPMACINRQLGHDGVEPAFANITGRPKWAIPWMENDPTLTQPQPWAARMRYDAVDARRFGCTGLFGIHWRTKALAPNLAALAAAAWDQSWVPASFDIQPVKPQNLQKAIDGALGGETASFTAPVAGATEPAVYQSVRWGLDSYNLTVPDGNYTVTLQFVEPAYAAAGKRVFDASIQGRQVITNLDIFAKAGQNKALDFSFPDIAVTNGTLRINFGTIVEFPCIAGIVISGLTKAGNQIKSEPFTRKINCGGGKVADYEADRTGAVGLPPADKSRAMPIEDFYIDFARANFGGTIAGAAGKILAKIDGVNMPRVSDWKTGPGDLVANNAPWSEVKKQYAFVDELAVLRSQIKSPGNLERFDYWLNTYRAMAAMAEAGCVRGQLDKAVAGKNYNQALTERIALAKAWTRLLTLQTAIVSTTGELGTIANLEQHTRRRAHFVDGHDAELIKALGAPLPGEAQPGGDYTGPSRIVVPTVRTQIEPGESLNLKVILLDDQPVKTAALLWRKLGRGGFTKVNLRHISRAVYSVTLPEAKGDFEYYIEAGLANGNEMNWPATAPALNQTVIVNQPERFGLNR
jgi:hypothetical protein